MKRLLLLFVFSICQTLCFAQTIENPVYDRSDIPDFHITKVKITKDTTYVFCLLYEEAGSWASISKETYLRDANRQKKFPLLKCEGLPFSPDTRSFPKNESCELLFCFPSIAGTEQFDFIESENEKAFNIYNVNLKRSHNTSLSDIELNHISEIVSFYDSTSDSTKTIQLKEYASLLNNLVSYNVSKGNIEEAIRLGTYEVKVKSKVFGSEHHSYIESLCSLAEHYAIIGNYEEAIRKGTEVANIRKKISDAEESGYIMSLSSLAYYYYKIGNYSEAIRLEKEAANILREVDGAEFDYASSLDRLTDYYIHSGKYFEALQVATEDLEIFKRVVGTDHPQYASSLNNIARIYSRLGNYSLAVRFGTEAKEIYKSTLGTIHPTYAMSLSHLAGYYQDLGYYDEALKLMTEARDIYKVAYGTEDINYGRSLNNLATFYLEVGNYSEAIRLGTEAMKIYKNVLGTKHPEYAISLNNLANYYSHVGNFSKSIKFGTEALETYKIVLGLEHPNYLTTLNILAINHYEIGNYSEAIKLGIEATELTKKTLGTEHPDYARSLNSLAAYNSAIGNLSEAIELGTKAMEIRKRVLGSEHPLFATSLLNQAAFYSYANNYDESIKLGIEAMEIFKRNFGSNHPFFALALSNLADNYQLLNQYEKSFKCLQQSLNHSQSFILHNFSELSSRNQETMWTKKYLEAFNNFLPSVVINYKTKESFSELYDKTCLFAKGILLNTNIEIRKLILESGDPVIIDKYNALVSNINMYNKLLETPIKARVVDIDSLNIVIERQEMMLATESKVFGDYSKNLNISWKDVQRGLGNNDIAIEFLSFPIYHSDSTMYIALTLKKEYDSPHLVTLFEEKQLKAIPKEVYYTNTNISDLVWKPLEAELRDVTNIYFAPSGELNRIGIEYFPISNTENISDVYTLHRLSSTRQLAIIQDKPDSKNTILYGGINYDKKPTSIIPDSTSVDGTVLRSAFSRANVDSLSLRSSFDYLEGTKREADMIAKDMKQHRVPYVYYSGTDGSEESFKNLDGTRPKTMHIATHGFYYTKVETENSQFARPEIELIDNGFQNKDLFIEDKPMTRSGLLFSGCNRAFRHEQIPEGEEDGILTAQEISTLDLRGLDLVVLSACQTGLGDVISGEGVFGLQRGFKKAGAKTLLMSLNKVDDEATRILMVEFYRNLMNGKTKHESLIEAQKYLREAEDGKYDDPKYWASFIMLDGLN